MIRDWTIRQGHGGDARCTAGGPALVMPFGGWAERPIIARMRWCGLLLLPMLCLAAEERAPGLRWFGYAAVDAGWDDPHDGLDKTCYLDEVAGFTNLAGMAVHAPDEAIEERLDAMAQRGVGAALDISVLFYERVVPAAEETGSTVDLRLRRDCRERWQQFLRRNRLAEHAASLACLYLADEPVWNGISGGELAAQAATVRESLSAVPLLVIEAWPVIDRLEVPKQVDWIGFDRYGVPDPEHDPSYREQFRRLKARRSRPDQRMAVVFESQWLPAYGPAGYPPAAMGAVAASYHRLAAEDPEVVALIGYLWPGGLDGATHLGGRQLPEAALQEHRRIGAAITGKPTPR